MSCGVGHRHGSDPALLWLWRRLAATAQIRHLAWEPPYATDAALQRQKKKKKKKISRQNPSGEPALGNRYSPLMQERLRRQLVFLAPLLTSHFILEGY